MQKGEGRARMTERGDPRAEQDCELTLHASAPLLPGSCLSDYSCAPLLSLELPRPAAHGSDARTDSEREGVRDREAGAERSAGVSLKRW